MNPPAERIAALIAAQGPVTVAQFMEMANGAYYATRDPFGRGGDFITAPEISQMFGELLGLWIVQCWIDQGRPAQARLVELGPGRGTLMADALRAARLVPEFLASIEIVLVENSARLRDIQRETLKDIPVHWHDAFDGTLDDRPLFLLANEFFDALPVNQYVKTGHGWHERMVTLDGKGELAFALSPLPMLLHPPRGIAQPGDIYETSPASQGIVQHIADIIARKGGAALIVDYGYGMDAGFGDTLQAVAAHRYRPVLDNPGEADLTAHVDFGALAQAARAAGAAAHGPIAQGTLLTQLGIVQRAQRLASAAGDEIMTQCARLIQPDQMGTLFQALAILPQEALQPFRNDET